MKAVLIRTGSSPIHSSSLINGSPKVSISYHDSVTGILFLRKNNLNSPRSNSLHLEIKETKSRKNVSRRSMIRRAYSENDMFRSVNNGYELTGIGSRSFPARIPEENEDFSDEEGDQKGSVVLKSTIWPESEVEVYSGGGIGRKVGGENGGDGGSGDEINGLSGDKNKIGTNYLEMLKVDPGNSLLLRNYGKFLHEVEGDVMKAEEYYSRAILANPSDGEVLSLYGKLIWETKRDGIRAKSYFDQAVQVAPHDCFVMGAYAHFLWDAEVDENEDEEEEEVAKITTTQSVLVQAL